MTHQKTHIVTLDERDVCEAICVWLKKEGKPAPSYVATVKGKCTWTHQPLAVRIEWSEDEAV